MQLLRHAMHIPRILSSVNSHALLLLAITCALPAWAEDPPAQILIARPGMQDPNFAQSVVLVTFPPDTGPMGVILNKPTPATLHDALPDEPALLQRTDIIYWGGPVQPNGLLAVFRMTPAPQRAVQVIGDIFFSGDAQIFEILFKQSRPTSDQKFFIGYAGWQPGQLEWEISHGAWFTLPADANIIFSMDSNTMWKELLKGASTPRIQALGWSMPSP